MVTDGTLGPWELLKLVEGRSASLHLGDCLEEDQRSCIERASSLGRGSPPKANKRTRVAELLKGSKNDRYGFSIPDAH